MENFITGESQARESNIDAGEAEEYVSSLKVTPDVNSKFVLLWPMSLVLRAPSSSSIRYCYCNNCRYPKSCPDLSPSLSFWSIFSRRKTPNSSNLSD